MALLAPAGASAAERARFVAAAPGDRAATDTLLKAEYGLAKAILARAPALEAAVAQAAEGLGRECKGVLRGAPDRSLLEEEGPFASRPKLSGRAQGEQARSEQEERTIDLEIGETISAREYRIVHDPYEAFIATADRLTWSDPAIGALVQQRATQLREDLSGPLVAVCAEMKAWAASGFHVLPVGSKSLEQAKEARDEQAVQGNLRALLRPYEGHAERVIVRRIAALNEQLRERERTDEGPSRAEHHMELALGEKLSRFEQKRFAPVIGKGRTHAGTKFVIRASVGNDSQSSCKPVVDVEFSERHGGSDRSVCLSEGGHAHPSGNCSGPVETIELATPPAARQARVRLSDGRTVTVSVIHVPAKYGGPAGVLIDAFDGHNRYPVSAQLLGRDGRILQTVPLSGVRCTGKLAGEGPGPPRFVDLATAISPSGESLIIEGTLHRFHRRTEFSLGPQPGMRGSEAGEENRAPKRQFQWSLSTECAPHAYTLLDGILAAPGASVLVRTPAGLVPLTKVELAASMHAAGPLFYGVYATPPTEIVVERSDGSVLYKESLAAKATEETEFCEGYAER